MFFKLSSLIEVVDSLRNMVYLVYLFFLVYLVYLFFLVYSVFWFICCRNPEGILEESYRNPVRILKESLRNPEGILKESYRNPVRILKESLRNPEGIL